MYLRSAHWHRFRAAWWAAHPGAVCADCGGGDHPMDLHHVTYQRLGHERFSDVVPLHRACHELRHGRVVAPGRRAVWRAAA
ncbi:MAG TPA: hypothetical protein VHT30_01485 [Acidimicrobiales bacterium]|nr:hypothetical protein [Acidimicrobiales bacterium]